MNNKGGVGKTTITAGIANALAAKGKKVLIIDTDGQANASLLFGYDPTMDHGEERLYNLVKQIIKKKEVSAADYILQTSYENIDIITGDGDMEEIRADIDNSLKRNRRVYKKIVDEVKLLDFYDYIFFDTAPSLDGSSLQILLASDYLLIPTTDSRFSTAGVGVTMELLEDVAEWGENVELLGIILNNVSAKSSLTSDIRNYFDSHEDTKGKVFETVVETSNVAKKLDWNGLKISANKTYVAFDAIAEEVISKIG